MDRAGGLLQALLVRAGIWNQTQSPVPNSLCFAAPGHPLSSSYQA